MKSRSVGKELFHYCSHKNIYSWFSSAQYQGVRKLHLEDGFAPSHSQRKRKKKTREHHLTILRDEPQNFSRPSVPRGRPRKESIDKFLSNVDWITLCPYFQQMWLTHLWCCFISMVCIYKNKVVSSQPLKTYPTPCQCQNIIFCSGRISSDVSLFAPHLQTKSNIDHQTYRISQRKCKTCWDLVTIHICYDSDFTCTTEGWKFKLDARRKSTTSCCEQLCTLLNFPVCSGLPELYSVLMCERCLRATYT